MIEEQQLNRHRPVLRVVPTKRSVRLRISKPDKISQFHPVVAIHIIRISEILIQSKIHKPYHVLAAFLEEAKRTFPSLQIEIASKAPALRRLAERASGTNMFLAIIQKENSRDVQRNPMDACIEISEVNWNW